MAFHSSLAIISGQGWCVVSVKKTIRLVTIETDFVNLWVSKTIPKFWIKFYI